MSTLALNIICGPGRAQILNRCLTTFNVKKVFDEIVIVNTSFDETVNDVAHKFTDKVFFFQWENDKHPYGDFGGARNFAASKTESDKIWWLDTDDACLDQYNDKLVKAVKLIKDDQYSNIKIWVMPYAIVLDSYGNPISWFMRERVFDRKSIHWKRQVHEIMYPGIEAVEYATINNMYISHLADKPFIDSAIRNVQILEYEYSRNPNDIQTCYFLGRDLIHCGRAKEGIKHLEKILSDLSASNEMLYAIAIELAWYYAYNGMDTKATYEKFSNENKLKVEGYCRLAIAFSRDYADPVVLLGDVYAHRNDISSAIRMYQKAIKLPIGVGKFQNFPMYRDIPAERLSSMFLKQSNYGLSWYYNGLNKKSEGYADRKNKLLSLMKEEV